MRKTAVGAAIVSAMLFSGDAFALTTSDVMRIMCCCQKVVRHGRVRIYRIPGGCKRDFGLSLQD